MKPIINITIGEKTYAIRYSIKALSMIEDLLKTSINTLDFSDLKINDLIKILYAGIVDKKDLTLNQLTDEIDENLDFKEAMEVINSAISSAFGINNEIENNEEKK